MGMGVGSDRGIKSDINVTPLVDVVLVLLIIFMVVTPMLQRGKDVKLPRAMKVEGEKKGDPIIVSVTTDKSIYIETDKLDDVSFQAELERKLTMEPGRRVLLKGDESLTFEDVRRVMNLARKAGAKAVALGVEEVKE